MKYRILSLLAFAGMFFSCCAVEETPSVESTICAVMENDDTRTSVTDEGFFTWSSGDQVWLHTTSGSVVGILSSGAGTPSAQFSFGAHFGEMTGKAVYPYNTGHSMSGNTLHVVMPASYDLGSSLENTNAAMYGVNVDGTIKFNHLAGVMRFTFKNVPAGANKFTITLDKKINGTFAADLTADYPIIEAEDSSSDADRTITLNFDALTEMSDICLNIPLPVGTYTTLDLGMYDDDTAIWTYSNTVTNTISRKTLKLMPTVTIGGTIGGEIEGNEPLGAPYIEFSPSGGKFDYSGGSGYADYVIYNARPNAELALSVYGDWITDVSSISSDSTEGRIYFLVEENNTQDVRYGDLMLNYAAAGINCSAKFYITQTCELSQIHLSSLFYNCNYASTTGEFSYAITNPRNSIDVEIESDSDWITGITDNDGVVTFTIAENNSRSDRSGIITIIYGSVSEEYRVSQSYEAPYIELSPLSGTFDYSGGSGYVDFVIHNVRQNAELKISAHGDWITDISRISSDSTEGRIYFLVEENNTQDVRYGDLYFEYSGYTFGNYNAKFYITQICK